MRKFLMVLTAILTLLSVPLAAWAETEWIDVTRSVEFSVRYEVEEAPVADVTFSLYRVADVDERGRFTLAGSFAGLPVVLEGLNADGLRDLAQTLSGYVAVDEQEGGNRYESVKVKTDGKGIADFGRVAPGLYLVVGETVVRGERMYRPGAVAAPLPVQNRDGTWNYVVTARAKQDVTELTHIRVVKRWEDEGAREERPESITVKLVGDGEVVETRKLTADTGWQYEWSNLDAGVEWSVVEYPSPENYSVSVSSDGAEFTLTNKYLPTPSPEPTPTVTTPTPTSTATPEPRNATATPEPTATPVPQTEVTGVKQWIDDDNAVGVRPESITLTLYANGVATSYAPEWGDRSGSTWSYAFRNLPQVDEAGNTIAYTVKESPVANYETTQSGTTITNKLIPHEPKEYIEVSGTKSWKNDSEEQRPESVTVRLLRDGEVVEEKTVTAADGWKYSFTNLPTDDGYGHDYTYDISEKMVSGYYTLKSGYDLTNVRVPDVPNNPDNPNEPGQPRTPGEPRKPRTPQIPPLQEEELEELIDIFDYGVPLWGGLLGTGDETPVYPYVFGGIGVAAVLVLLVFGRKKKKDD